MTMKERGRNLEGEGRKRNEDGWSRRKKGMSRVSTTAKRGARTVVRDVERAGRKVRTVARRRSRAREQPRPPQPVPGSPRLGGPPKSHRSVHSRRLGGSETVAARVTSTPQLRWFLEQHDDPGNRVATVNRTVKGTCRTNARRLEAANFDRALAAVEWEDAANTASETGRASDRARAEADGRILDAADRKIKKVQAEP